MNKEAFNVNFHYKLFCDAKDLGLLGTGYAMYYEFQKGLVLVLFLETIFVSVICMILSSAQLTLPNYLKSLASQPSQSFIGQYTLDPILRTISRDGAQSFLADIYVSCNFAGIFYLLIFSILERRRMSRLQDELDKDKDTPSDYAVIVRNLPRDLKAK